MGARKHDLPVVLALGDERDRVHAYEPESSLCPTDHVAGLRVLGCRTGRWSVAQCQRRIEAGHPLRAPRGAGGLVDARDDSAGERVRRIADAGRHMGDGGRRHPEGIAVVEAADAGIVLADTGVVQDDRACARPRGEIPRVHSAVRAPHHDRAGALRAELGHGGSEMDAVVVHLSPPKPVLRQTHSTSAGYDGRHGRVAPRPHAGGSPARCCSGYPCGWEHTAIAASVRAPRLPGAWALPRSPLPLRRISPRPDTGAGTSVERNRHCA